MCFSINKNKIFIGYQIGIDENKITQDEMFVRGI
jgi:hypothetical protein